MIYTKLSLQKWEKSSFAKNTSPNTNKKRKTLKANFMVIKFSSLQGKNHTNRTIPKKQRQRLFNDITTIRTTTTKNQGHCYLHPMPLLPPFFFYPLKISIKRRKEKVFCTLLAWEEESSSLRTNPLSFHGHSRSWQCPHPRLLPALSHLSPFLSLLLTQNIHKHKINK